MSRLQRIILLVGALLMLVSVLFPPWAYERGSFAGYHFLCAWIDARYYGGPPLFASIGE